jgi:oligosaccharide repeat unit polymerase
VTIAVLFVIVLTTSFLLRRVATTWLHPLPAYFALWSLVALLLVWNPVHLTPITSKAVELILEGLAAVAAGGLVTFYWPRPSTAGPPAVRFAPDAPQLRESSSIRLLVVTAVALLIVLAGTYLVRGSIAATAGQSYSNLTPSQIRQLATTSGASNAGLASLAYLNAPIVAALGIVIARRKALGRLAQPLGCLVVALAVGATVLTPDRTFTITTAVISLLFWLYSRPVAARRQSGRATLAIVLVAVASVSYFLYEGGKLQQNSLLTTSIPNASIPSVLVPSFVYITAGPPSLSVAMAEHLNPAYGEPLHSLWLLARVAHLVDKSVRIPNTVASYVPIPFDFNTYTWIGDVFFDFGALGVVVLGFASGLLVCLAYAWATLRRTPAAQFTSAVLAALLFFSIINFRFFWLECPAWLVLGALFLRLAASPQPRPL